LQSYSAGYRKSNSTVATSACGHEVELLSKGLVSNRPAPIRIAAARLELGHQNLSPKKGEYGFEKAGLCCGRQRWGWRWGVSNNFQVTLVLNTLGSNDSGRIRTRVGLSDHDR
jgi:hypothetical protein